jgi:hypothetical protein
VSGLGVLDIFVAFGLFSPRPASASVAPPSNP